MKLSKGRNDLYENAYDNASIPCASRNDFLRRWRRTVASLRSLQSLAGFGPESCRTISRLARLHSAARVHVSSTRPWIRTMRSCLTSELRACVCGVFFFPFSVSHYGKWKVNSEKFLKQEDVYVHSKQESGYQF